MKTPLRFLLGLFATVWVALPLAKAKATNDPAGAVTPPAGYFKLTARGASDSWLSLPLVRRSALLGRVTAVGSNTITLSVSGVADGAYAASAGSSYYAQFVSGNLNGVCCKIASNTANIFTLETQGDDLSNHALGQVTTGAAGDFVRIRPYWTISDLFGSDAATLSLDPVPDLSGSSYLEKDEIRFPDNESIGTDKSPAAVVAYVAGTGWRQRGDTTTDVSSKPLLPGIPFIVRRQNTAPAEVLLLGYVPQEKIAVRLPALSDADTTDVAVAWTYPDALALSSSGLASVVEEAESFDVVRDLLLDFSNSRVGFSLPPEQRLHRFAGEWYLDETVASDYPIKPGVGYILRLRGARPQRFWFQQSPE